MPSWNLVALLAAGLALAGCTDGGTDDDAPEPTPTSSAGPTPREAPDELSFSFGPSLGCEGSTTAQGACVSFQAGPGNAPVDGFWVALDERYHGLAFTTTVETVTGDSDCYFVSEGLDIVGEANQGAAACAGTYPDNAAYIFLYSYVEPSQGMTLAFTLPA